MANPADPDDSERITLTDRALLDEELEDLDAAESSPVAVTYSTQDYPVDGLVKRLRNESMLIPQFGNSDDRVITAGFQRGFVWTRAQMDKFIESLLLGYPIPAIFLVKQEGDNRLLVLDGQQRLVTLRHFYDGIHAGKEFALTNVGTAYKGLTYKSLDASQQRQLDDSFMQATIVTADGSNEVADAIYQIFERLNSGGTQLTPHEIRVALYAGDLVASIERLNEDSSWRSLYGAPSKRIRDHELVMRILAMYKGSDSYSRPMKQFLNKYAANNRSLNVYDTEEGALFRSAAMEVSRHVGRAAFRKAGSQLNVAQTEAIMVAAMHALAVGGKTSELKSRISALKADRDFDLATSRATADTESVHRRHERALSFIEGNEDSA